MGKCQADKCNWPALVGREYCLAHQAARTGLNHDEIYVQPTRNAYASDVAADIARAKWGVDVQPPQRPEDDGRWA